MAPLGLNLQILPWRVGRWAVRASLETKHPGQAPRGPRELTWGALSADHGTIKAHIFLSVSTGPAAAACMWPPQAPWCHSSKQTGHHEPTTCKAYVLMNSWPYHPPYRLDEALELLNDGKGALLSMLERTQCEAGAWQRQAELLAKRLTEERWQRSGERRVHAHS